MFITSLNKINKESTAVTQILSGATQGSNAISSANWLVRPRLLDNPEVLKRFEP